ncbi:MAG TPA: phage tail sheath C-terminal domain-containing protein [Saprospiraceae bacterium]|nr:phage tail sheath C-terminal domain-containing protein [Saprospiraceae bacterium]
MDYKTPGVFIEEVALFPPSVAAVATAIPAFIGHTAITQDAGQVTLINRPIRITSLLDFTQLYGGPYNPVTYTVQVNPAAAFTILEVTPVNGRRYYLFDAVRHYFDNGGGPCYIVTVGDYVTPVSYGTDTTGLRGGLRSLEKVDEPTLLVAPDSAALRQGDGTPDFVQSGNLHKDIIDQCGRLQDRFGILDVMEGYRAPDHVSSPIQQFRNQVGTENLKYAATYYPWLGTTYLKDVHFAQLLFVDNQAIPVAIPDATINTMTGLAEIDGLVTTLRAQIADEQRVFSKIISVPLDRSNYNPLSDQLQILRSDVLAANTAALARPAFAAMMLFVREIALAFRDLENDAGNPAELIVLLTQLEADTTLRTQLTNLIAFEKNVSVMNSIALARVVADVVTDYAPVNSQDWIGGVTVASIAANVDDFTNGGTNTVAQTAHACANSSILQAAFDEIAQAFTALIENALFRSDQAEKNLFSQHPFFKAVFERIRKEMSFLPPSGAAAGVYAGTDRTRGVWKAPANVSLRGVITPAYKLTDQEQSTLNVHETGKSINAIRAFTGKGILVWGARTLSGNDNEWRYINVRRFFNFVEESTKKASEPFVFESNDANTWIRVRAMIENFLTIQWRQGALAGATAKEAFYVKVGLGETMTALDILEGRMIVEIGMAAVRPAEFIILRFSHKMQES